MHTHTQYNADLFSFISQAPSAYHVVRQAISRLQQAGFQQLKETHSWKEITTGNYFVVRNDASLIAFTLTGAPNNEVALRMGGAHTDSPGLRLKPNPLQKQQSCLQLGVEVYGGPLLAPWFDRELSIAGRVSWYKEGEALHASLLDFQQPVAIIPSLAIHLDREANTKRSIDKQTDLVPVVMLSDQEQPDFKAFLAQQLNQQHPESASAEIADFDLFLYDVTPPQHLGFDQSLIVGPRLDNQLSCHALLESLIQCKERKDCLIILNDHEEIGSVSTSGAQGPFLRTVLKRLFPDIEDRQQILSRSFLISVDNAHAVHPNFAGKHEPNHLPLMNKGPVIKINANQRYASTGVTGALFQRLCQIAGVPCQHFVMRNDLACGSTIGPLTAAEIGVPTVDVGVAQLAMHSIRETIGNKDAWYLSQVLRMYFQAETHLFCCPESF